MLTLAIQSATKIKGIKLSEIGIAFFEIFSEFKTPLNRFVYNFYIDISKYFFVNYQKRLNEFEPLVLWGNLDSEDIASIAFLRYALTPIDCYEPKFVFKTMVALIQTGHFLMFGLRCFCFKIRN